MSDTKVEAENNSGSNKRQKTLAGGARRVLVTGGSGMVGQAIKSYVTQVEEHSANTEWLFASSRDGDLLSYESTRAMFDRFQPTHVIHLAAIVGGLFHNLNSNVRFFRENVAINDNILRCCSETGVVKCVSCLSTCIFPDKISYPITEDKLHQGPPHDSNEGYSYAKRMLDVLSRLYNREKGTKFVTVTPCNIYGLFDNFHLQESHVLPGLIHKAYLAKKNNEQLTVLGTGKPLRQFLFSKDLAKLIVWAMNNYEDTNENVILTVDEADEISIGDLAQKIAKAIGLTTPLLFDTSKSDGQFKKTVSNAKLRSLIGDFDFTPLDQGIQETVDWFLQNYPNVRM